MGRKIISNEIALPSTFTAQKDQEGKRKKKKKHFIGVTRYFYKDISFAVRKTGMVVSLPIQG